MNKNYALNNVSEIKSIDDMLNRAVREAGSNIAFMFKENNDIIQKTYIDFNDDTLALGSALTKIGMNNKHIACIGDNSYKWLTTYLTVLRSEGVFVPIDKELPIADIINVLNNSECEVLFYASKFDKYISQILNSCSCLKYVVGFSNQENDGNILSYSKFLEEGYVLSKNRKTRMDTSKNIKKLDNLKLLVYTSGTTGMAKGVMLTERNLISCVYYGLQVSTVYNRCLSVLPYHHTYEAVAGILVAIHHHSTICINDSLKNVLKNLQLYKPDYIYIVPAFAELFYKKIWASIIENKKEKLISFLIKFSNFIRIFGVDVRKKLFRQIHETFGGNLIKIVCGGAPIRAEIGKFFDDIGIVLVNGYGITECSPLVSANRDKFNDPKTVGVMLPCVKAKIVNPDEDGNGEIHVKGKTVMKGYYKNEKLTKEVLKNGWFNTGDYGNINKLGQLSITGRKKNLIVLNNGKNVFPEEIEGYIAKIPYVQEVVVRGIKEDNREVGLLAEVYLNQKEISNVLADDLENMLKKDICEVTRELPVYKKITEIKIRENEFEKTTTNKIKR